MGSVLPEFTFSCRQMTDKLTRGVISGSDNAVMKIKRGVERVTK